MGFSPFLPSHAPLEEVGNFFALKYSVTVILFLAEVKIIGGITVRKILFD